MNLVLSAVKRDLNALLGAWNQLNLKPILLGLFSYLNQFCQSQLASAGFFLQSRGPWPLPRPEPTTLPERATRGSDPPSWVLSVPDCEWGQGGSGGGDQECGGATPARGGQRGRALGSGSWCHGAQVCASCPRLHAGGGGGAVRGPGSWAGGSSLSLRPGNCSPCPRILSGTRRSR